MPGSQVSQWVTNADKKIDIPTRGGPGNGWVQYVDDPLTSLTNLSPGSAGDWSVDTYVKASLAGASAQMRALHATTTPTSPCAYLMECEVEIPTNFSTNNDHICIGWLVSDTTGKWVANLRGDNVVVFLQDGVGWSATSGYTHGASGTWTKIRVLWNDATDTWQLWIDGVSYLTATINQTFSTSMRPTLLYYNDTAGTATRFRNLKAWYQINASYTDLPA
jgi:hypothetical protein